MENLEITMMAMDEIVDDGMIMEIDSAGLFVQIVLCCDCRRLTCALLGGSHSSQHFK